MKAAETARRNLLQRIERLLETIAREGRSPGDRESLWIQRAIGAMRTQGYRQGEDDMLWAERPDIFRTSEVFSGDAKVLGLVELRALLQAAVR